MAREHLSKRANWQKGAHAGGDGKEAAVRGIIETHLNDNYDVVKETIPVYANGRGVRFDTTIKNNTTGKIALIEIKRQGKDGNAHERLCRNYMIGLQKVLSAYCGYDNPVFTICCNGLAKDQHKKQEIPLWFQGMDDRLFLWKGQDYVSELIDYIENTIIPYLN